MLNNDPLGKKRYVVTDAELRALLGYVSGQVKDYGWVDVAAAIAMMKLPSFDDALSAQVTALEREKAEAWNAAIDRVATILRYAGAVADMPVAENIASEILGLKRDVPNELHALQTDVPNGGE